VQSAHRKISATFWGQAWCRNLEHFSDYETRLPRGRSYLRHGSVVHLAMTRSKIEALVQGSSVYTVEIQVTPLPETTWSDLRSRCQSGIGSLLELLAGDFSDAVMAHIAQPEVGLFPSPGELEFTCSCPDWAEMCKHVAATLYGIGARLDRSPELLFELRGVDPEELTGSAQIDDLVALPSDNITLLEGNLAAIFGIELEEDIDEPASKPGRKKTRRKEK
jgi:uncharacterized Zn finger protein